ncbi:virulence-associated E family protein [Plesiomonas shigelloides]|uniref:VapE domain-containing protein n=1 Tax=Plesiomonas shigelloides TaxID=703 RepID=UPI00351D8D52
MEGSKMTVIPQPNNVLPFDLPAQTKLEAPKLVDYSRSEKPRPLGTSANLAALLSFYDWKPAFNDMTAEPTVISVPTGERVGGSDDGQRSKLIDACERHCVPKAVIDEHLTALCQSNSFHPVRQWLESGEPWDKVERVNDVIDTLNAKEPEFARSVMRAWLVAAMAALYESTFICKLVPVLQGQQSAIKSAWVSRLASVVSGSRYEGRLEPDKVDHVRQVTRAWIAELAELESTTKHDAGVLKAFITTATDVFRLPFARNPTYKRRQTVFIGTVNGTDFLKDLTGNTRFFVIELSEEVNIDRVNELLGWEFDNERITLREPEQLRQFWLEVKELYLQGATWGLDEVIRQKQAKINDAHTDKGSHYQYIADYHLGENFKVKRWFTAGQLVSYHSAPIGQSGAWGRALKLLTQEGLIESRTGRSRRTEYRLPVPSNSANRENGPA